MVTKPTSVHLLRWKLPIGGPSGLHFSEKGRFSLHFARLSCTKVGFVTKFQCKIESYRKKGTRWVPFSNSAM